MINRVFFMYFRENCMDFQRICTGAQKQNKPHTLGHHLHAAHAYDGRREGARERSGDRASLSKPAFSPAKGWSSFSGQ